MDRFKEFPKLTKFHRFLSSLRRETHLEMRPRLIPTAITRRNVREFEVGPAIESFLARERLPGGGGESVKVDVYYRNAGETAEKHSLELRKEGGHGYVFSGDLIDIIVNNNENQEIELWGYPERGIFVLTVGGVSKQSSWISCMNACV